MIRLFGRFLLVLLTMFAASYVLGTIMLVPPMVEESADSTRIALAGAIRTATQDIATMHGPARAEAVEAWGTRLGMPAVLHDTAGPAPGEATVTSRAPVKLGIRVDDAQWVEFGPVPDHDWSGTRDALNYSGFIDGALIIVAAMMLSWPLVRRLRSLRDAAERIRGGQYEARTGLGGRDIVGQVATRFDEMASAVERSLAAQKELTQAVSHEFRTPLTRIRFAAEELATTDDEAARRARYRDIDRDLDELDDLVEEMLTYGRLESAAFSTEEVAVGEVVVALAERMRDLGPRVVVGTSDSTTAVVFRREFIRAVQNLVANAQRHAAQRVEVSWEVVDEGVLIHVDDDGDGVPPARRQQIFEPFASGPRGGYGLGLALVRRIAHVHGGEVEVSDGPLGGARFTLSLPA